MKDNYIISTFVHVLDDSTLWNAITKEKIKVENEIVDYVLKNKENKSISNIPESIKKDSRIITTISDEKALIDRLVNETTDSQFQGLYLITTTSCNLNCEYCFYRSEISRSLMKRRNMSFEVAKTAVDKFKQITDKNIKSGNYWQQITLYGGEPSLNKDLLKKIIPYIRNSFHDEYTSIVINTNLTIFDEELFKLYKEYNIEVQVSLDGTKEQHDCHRKTQLGEGSFDVVINNILYLKNMGINIVPMITATDANVDNFSDVLCSIVEMLDINDFGVNILITDSYKTGSDYPIKLAKEMIKAYKKLGKSSFDYSFIDLYDGILGASKSISKNACGSGRKITVFPDGKVFSCQALEKHPMNSMGTLEDNFITNPNWTYWRKRNRFSNEKCLKCEAIGSCGGGCSQGSYNKFHNIYDVDYNQCEYTKALFKELHHKNE